MYFLCCLLPGLSTSAGVAHVAGLGSTTRVEREQTQTIVNESFRVAVVGTYNIESRGLAGELANSVLILL